MHRGPMTHEFRKILHTAGRNSENGLKNVLATVVALDGSSYRRPGVRMLIAEDGSMTGAVSGGCVEKDVLLQARAVFKDGMARIMTYDGRYRLGCEGILYILLETFYVTEELRAKLDLSFKERNPFSIKSFYKKGEATSAAFGSEICFEDGSRAAFSKSLSSPEEEGIEVFEQELKPLFRMIIIGAEHDAVQLSSAAALLGWEVSVIASPKDPRTTANFPGAAEVLHLSPQEVRNLKFDRETAVVLMNHNYATDLQFLLAIKDKDPAYIGLLGAAKRREKLFNEIIEFHPEIDSTFLDRIHGPAGLHIGAETPQEIAVSIIAEVLSVIRKKEAFPLRDKSGAIHN